MGKKSRVAAAALALAAGIPFAAGPASATSATDAAIQRANTSGIPWYLVSFLDMLFGDSDPTLIGGKTRHEPWTQNINGAVSQLPESRTSSISTLVWAGYDLSDHLGIGPNQRAVIGAFYRHDRAWTSFSGAGEQSSSNNALGLLFAYALDSWHFSGAAAFDWGSGKLTSLPSGNEGSFDTSGKSVAFQVGRVFTLTGDVSPATRANLTAWPFGTQQMSIYLDPAFRVGYARGVADAFANSASTLFGKEVERAWTIGGSVTLSAVIPQGAMLWRPYIEFSLDRQVGYRHTIDQPGTGLVAHLEHNKTFVGVSGGVGVWFNRNISAGVSGFYRGSGSQDTGGGLIWLRVNLFGPGGYLRGGMQNR